MSGEPTDVPGDAPSPVDLRVDCYGLVLDEGGLLLAHWNEGGLHAWTLPGGGMEPGEHPEQTVVRELKEETGFDVRVDGIVGADSIMIPAERRVSAPGRALHGVRMFYRCTIIGGRFEVERDGTTDDVGWFPLDEVGGLRRVGMIDRALAFAGEVLPADAIEAAFE